MRLHLLGRGRGRPGILLLQFGLGFVKHLLDFPAGLVEQHQQPWFQRHFRGEIDIDLAVARIAKGDFTHPKAAPVFHHPIPGDALIDGLGEINGPLLFDCQAQARFAQRQEVNPRRLTRLPKGQIDPGLVPHPQHLAAFACTLA